MTVQLPARLRAQPKRTLVGRTAELIALDSAVDSLVEGSGVPVVLLAGDAGAGKTTLAADVARRAFGRGCRVFYGRGQEGLDRPFGVWRQALGTAWPAEERERDELFDAVVLELERAAKDAPLLVILDDLQWVDQAALLLITHVCATYSTGRLALLLSYRSTEAAPDSALGALLGTLGREPGVHRLELQGLSAGDVETLLSRDRGRALDDGERHLARRIWADTCGNAFFVNALLDEVLQGRSSSSLREVVGYRVTRLGAHGAEVMRAAAVIGEVFDADGVAEVSGIERASVAAVMDSALADGLLAEVGAQGFSFAHALVSETLAAEVPAAKRRELHRAAAVVLRLNSGDPAAIAHHMAAADPDDKAGRIATVEAAIEAGTAALASMAYEDAVARLRYAVEMADRWGLGERLRYDAVYALANAQITAGAGDEALESVRSALPLSVELEQWDDVTSLLIRFPTAPAAVPDRTLLRALERAAAEAPADTPVGALALATQAWLLHYTESHERLRALAERAVMLADAQGDTASKAYTRSMLVLALGGDPDLKAQLDLVAALEALAGLRPGGPSRSSYELAMRRVYVLMRMGDFDAIDRETERLRRESSERGLERARWWLLNLRAVRSILVGHLDDAERFSVAAAEIERHGSRASTSARLAHISVISYLKGGFGELCDTIAAVMAEFPIPALKAVFIDTLATAGRVTEARALLREMTAHDLAAVPRDDTWTTSAFMLADACRQVEARYEAEVIYRALLPHAGEFVVTSAASAACFGPVDRALGQLAAVCGWEDVARRHLEDAVMLCARTGARPFLALARVEQATLGVPGAAEEARTIASELGLDLVFQRLPSDLADAAAPTAALAREGDYWRVTYGGRTVHVKDLRGLHYLRELLGRAGREVAAVELEGSVGGGGGQTALDAVAKLQYRRRLEEIDDELYDAESCGDVERVARAAAERDLLAQELARAVGLGGRSRVVGSVSERARLNVTRALRAAIDRIASLHPELGAHLRLAIRTGTYCSYQPDPSLALRWQLEQRSTS